jgi:hypothetical protein
MASNPPLHQLRMLVDTNVLLDQLLRRERGSWKPNRSGKHVMLGRWLHMSLPQR